MFYQSNALQSASVWNAETQMCDVRALGDGVGPKPSEGVVPAVSKARTGRTSFILLVFKAGVS